MEYHVKDILKIGIKATFTDQIALAWKDNIAFCCISRIFYNKIIIWGRFRTPLNILDGAFCKSNQQIEAVNYFLKSLLSRNTFNQNHLE